MAHVTCRLTAKNRDQLRNPTLGNRVRAAFAFFTAKELTKPVRRRTGVKRGDHSVRTRTGSAGARRGRQVSHSRLRSGGGGGGGVVLPPPPPRRLARRSALVAVDWLLCTRIRRLRSGTGRETDRFRTTRAT